VANTCSVVAPAVGTGADKTPVILAEVASVKDTKGRYVPAGSAVTVILSVVPVAVQALLLV
jgi:hypothetical protein